MPRAASSTGDGSVDIGIVCALELEADPLMRQLRRRRMTIGNRFILVQGQLGAQRVAVIRAGMSPRRLLVGADALLYTHRPLWLVSSGFAVGLDVGLSSGTILIAEELVDAQGSKLELPRRASLVRGAGPGVQAGRLVSLARWPRSMADKRALADQSGAVAADWHSFALARLCAESGIRFLAVRAVVDDVSQDAPPELRVVLNPSRSYRAGASLGALWGGSGRIGRIWKMRSALRAHAERLARLLTQLMPRLAG